MQIYFKFKNLNSKNKLLVNGGGNLFGEFQSEGKCVKTENQVRLEWLYFGERFIRKCYVYII